MTATTSTLTEADDLRVGRRRAERVAAAACATTVLLFAAALAAAQVSLHGLVLAAVLAAALLVGLAALSLLMLALVARRRLRELRHLPDLGRRFVTHHDHVQVRGVVRDPSGDLVLEVSSLASHTVLLDDEGMPDRISAGGPTITRWRVHGSAQLDESVVLALGQLQDQDELPELVSHGVVTLLGPVPLSWCLQAGGLVVQSGA